MDNDSQKRAAALRKKLEIEERCYEGAISMRQSLTDPNALSLCDASCVETARRIEFLRSEIESLTFASRGSSDSDAEDVKNNLSEASLDTGDKKSEINLSSVGNTKGDTASSPVSSQQGRFQSAHRNESHKSIPSLPSTLAAGGSMGSMSSIGPVLDDRSSDPVWKSASKSLPANLQSIFLSAPSSSVARSQNDLAFSSGSSSITSLSSTGALLDFSNPSFANVTNPLSNILLSIPNSKLTGKKVDVKLNDLTSLFAGVQNTYRASSFASSGSGTEKATFISSNEVSSLSFLPDFTTSYSSLRLDALREAANAYIGLSSTGSSFSANKKIAASEPMPNSSSAYNRMRRPLSGDLDLNIGAVSVPLTMKSGLVQNKSLMFAVVISVDGHPVVRTKIVKTQLSKKGADMPVIFNQTVSLKMNKANEVELDLIEVDKNGLPRNLYGIFWFRLHDFFYNEEKILKARRASTLSYQKDVGFTSEASPTAASSASASKLSQEPTTSRESMQVTTASAGGNILSSSAATPTAVGGAEDLANEQKQEASVSGWFSMEPKCFIMLNISFIADTSKPQASNGLRLGRNRAVIRTRKIKATSNGHIFVLQNFTGIMKCGLCAEFIGMHSCYVCSLCKLACHKECAGRVMFHCRLSSNEGVDGSGKPSGAGAAGNPEQLMHCIPHRFVPSLNLAATWCCHCGHIASLGRKNFKCADCDIFAHATCSQHVPTFCGLDMKRANRMLHEITRANEHRALIASRTAKTAGEALGQALPPASLPSEVSADSKDKESSSTMGHLDEAAAKRKSQEAASTLTEILQVEEGKKLDSEATKEGKDEVVAVKSRPQSKDAQDFEKEAAQERSGEPAGEDFAESMLPSSSGVKKCYKLDDFRFVSVLGKGNFGKVMLAEENLSKKLYAIKVLKKDFVIKSDEVESTKSEKNIFCIASKEKHPFLLNLLGSFQSQSRLFFIMEYVAGGDLMLHIQRRLFTENQARFYACEVLLALEFFHKKRIIYRDLKLDNIMLCADGHIKIADYGLCKMNMGLNDTTTTFCGTPEFMAPEILHEQPYNRVVDWWAFGVLVYEMLCGQSPFRGEDEDTIFESIIQDDVLYPISMSRYGVSICQLLLVKNPKNRLGSGPDDAEAIKRHPFFRGVDWDAVYHKRYAPQYFPSIKDGFDVNNFDAEFTNEPVALTPNNSVIEDIDQSQFDGFSFVADW